MDESTKAQPRGVAVLSSTPTRSSGALHIVWELTYDLRQPRVGIAS